MRTSSSTITRWQRRNINGPCGPVVVGRQPCEPHYPTLLSLRGGNHLKEDLVCKIWEKFKVAHGENDQMKACLFATYRMEYENFTHLPGESIDSMF
jgi:hypothetical protein